MKLAWHIGIVGLCILAIGVPAFLTSPRLVSDGDLGTAMLVVTSFLLTLCLALGLLGWAVLRRWKLRRDFPMKQSDVVFFGSASGVALVVACYVLIFIGAVA